MQPYYFTPSQSQATSVAEFLAVCQAEPHLAAYHLQEGYFEPWLRDLGRKDLAEAAAQMRLGGSVTRQQLREFVQAALDNEARRASTRTGKTTRASAGHLMSAVLGAASLSVVGLAMSCAPPAPTAGPNPTVPSAQQGVATAAPPTVQSAQTPVSTSTAVLGVATRITPTVAAARTQISATVATGATGVAGAQTQIPAAVATGGTGVAAQGDPQARQPTSVTAAQQPTGVTAAQQPTGVTAAQQPTDVTVAREGTAKALAPTAQAVATLVAPTVQATATQVVAAVGTSVAASPVHVTDVNVGPTDTIVSIQNSGLTPMTLSGWTLLVGPGFSIQLSDIQMKAGQTRKLHFSQGTDTDSDVFLGAGYDVGKSSLQPGTRVVLIAPSDQIASVYPIM